MGVAQLASRALVVAWGSALFIGATAILRYEFTPAPCQAAVSDWPLEAQLQPSKNRPTLLMFVHPHCPCSRASLAELSKVVEQFRKPITLHIIFFRPAEFAAGWDRTNLYSLAERIPNATLSTDVDGHEARRFGVSCSGETLLYNSRGILQFQGGLTSARGHEGTSTGAVTILKIINEDQTHSSQTSVFGCALTSETNLPKDDSQCQN